MSGLRILIVDDDAEIVSLVDALLRSLGHKPTPAVGPREGLALFHAGAELDLVLTDCVMPEIDGLELASRIHDLRPDMPVAFMTSRQDYIDVLHQGNLPVLTKPFGLPELQKLLERAMDAADSTSGKSPKTA